MLDVRDYGAIGDGISDDTAASVDENMILTFAQLAADATATILRDDSICYWHRKS